MIINQDVCVAMTSKNVEHFKSKGFEPKYYIDKENKTRLRQKRIIVNVFDLQDHSMVKINVECDNCKNIFSKTYKDAVKRKNSYCCRDCESKHKQAIELIKFEERIGEDAYAYLHREYIEKQRTFRQIANDIYGNPKNNSSIGMWIKKFNIPIRYGSEAIKSQWIDNEDRRKRTSEIAKISMCTEEARNKVRKAQQTEEYKKKQSESKKGSKNGMWRQ